ncbi:hypothetical protein M408DRAFT_207940 [Serendipita vermifera MAFF 305830]|uniref:Uncharacterized protein n=1 Tax=Serendipita vermifera MAFF 305830 TaxID=933852 RepID=A0A0C3B1X8_SERVB|nr:hypothetical protein M408DRAFT_207940 [Serendipita vermifera MAFF 305830]
MKKKWLLQALTLMIVETPSLVPPPLAFSLLLPRLITFMASVTTRHSSCPPAAMRLILMVAQTAPNYRKHPTSPPPLLLTIILLSVSCQQTLVSFTQEVPTQQHLVDSTNL